MLTLELFIYRHDSSGFITNISVLSLFFFLPPFVFFLLWSNLRFSVNGTRPRRVDGV